MQSINDSTVIDVQNHLDNVIVVPTNIKPDGYVFEPGTEMSPYTLQLSFAEIRGINSNSNVFREGFLRFRQDSEKEVYEKLGIRNYQEILSDEDIRDIILNPSKEKLELVVNIQSASLFERIRGMLIMLENQGHFDISTRVKSLINARYDELYRGKRKSEIVVRSTASELNEKVEQEAKKQYEEETDKLKKEIEELKSLLQNIQTQNNKAAQTQTASNQKREMSKDPKKQ